MHLANLQLTVYTPNVKCVFVYIYRGSNWVGPGNKADVCKQLYGHHHDCGHRSCPFIPHPVRLYWRI